MAVTLEQQRAIALARARRRRAGSISKDDAPQPPQGGLTNEEIDAQRTISPAADTAMGVAELAANFGTSAVLEPIAGLAGVVQSINPFSGEGAGADAVKSIKDLAYKPRERGMDVLASAGEQAKTLVDLAPDALKSGVKAIQQSPDAVADEYGPLPGAIAKTLPIALMSLPALMPAKPASVVTKTAYQTPGKRQIARKIQQGIADPETAGFKLKPQGPTMVRPPERLTPGGGRIGPDGLPTGERGAQVGRQPLLSMDRGGPRVQPDAKARAALRQDFDPSVIAGIKEVNPATKAKLREIVEVTDLTRKNKFALAETRNSNVVGESVLNRYRVVRGANKVAASQLDDVAKSLKGQRIDPDPAVNSFLDDLARADVRMDASNNPIFQGSAFEGANGPINVLKNVVRRMRETRTPDAYDLHRLKRYIDEQVTYGKNAEGLAGSAETMLKRLRHNLDSLLDSKFTEYNRVNSTYSETRNALDALQDVAGRKMDLSGPNADSAVGTLMRRVLSNQQSRVRVIDAVKNLDTVAQKHIPKGVKTIPYGAKQIPDISDDINRQIVFLDEMERRFGSSAPNSFQGQIIQGIETAAMNTQKPMSLGELPIEAAKAGYKAVRGINDDKAMSAIRDLLKD